jgi:hypothetical protein
MGKRSAGSRIDSQRATLLMPREEAKQKLQAQISKGEELKAKEIGSKEALDQTRAEYYRWDTYNGKLLEAMFSTDAHQRDYLLGYGGLAEFRSLAEGINSLRDDIKYAISKVQNVLDAIDLVTEAESIQQIERSSGGMSILERRLVQSNRVFVVHGHDEAAKQETARLLAQLKLDPVILSERENLGRTIIEKFEHFSDVGFAVVLLTPDDLGATVAAVNKDGSKALVNRARQNVVFEMGFFYGRLGRHKVCALLKPGTEKPSDLDGIVYTAMDAAGAWKMELAKEMKAAGLPIDLNDLYR